MLADDWRDNQAGIVVFASRRFGFVHSIWVSPLCGCLRNARGHLDFVHTENAAYRWGTEDPQLQCPVCNEQIREEENPKTHLRHHKNWWMMLKHLPFREWEAVVKAERERQSASDRALERQKALVDAAQRRLEERQRRARESLAAFPPTPAKHRQPPEPIRLKSKRGLIERHAAECARCGRIKAPTWRHNTIQGKEIRLCSSCRAKVLDQNFGKVDAMNRRLPGGFEQGRRR